MSAWRDLPATATAAQACEQLRAAGWRQVGAGDWAWAFADPTDTLAARITPFDPGYRMFAEDCRDGAPNRWLPRVAAVVPLAREGYAVIMERLWSAPEATASAFCAGLGIPNGTGYAPPTAGPFDGQDHPDLPALKARIEALMGVGAARYQLWAGSDIREGNIMADASGALKLVDPIGVAGWKIAAALGDGDKSRLMDFSHTQLRDFLDIPYFGPGREGAEQRDLLLAQLGRLFAA